MSFPDAYTLCLNSRRRVACLLVGIAISSFVWSVKVITIVVADHLSESTRFEDISLASELDPRNPEYQYRTGLYYETDSAHMNIEKATLKYREAITLQPNVAAYWMSLGRACFAVGDDLCSYQAFSKAVLIAPSVPRYYGEIANYYLLAGRNREALLFFRYYLQFNRSDPSPTFRVLMRAFNDPELIWRALLHNIENQNLKMDYIKFLTESGYPGVAYQLWNDIAANHPTLSFKEVQPYLEELISRHRIPEASKIWKDLEILGVIQMSEPENQLFNGSFESEPLNAGFDWRYRPQPYLALDFGGTGCYEGSHCLFVNFTAPSNADLEPVSQLVPVTPNQQYLLSAYVRSSNLTSDSGPRLRVVDFECPTCLLGESESTTGTTGWHEILLPFHTGPISQAVSLSIWRQHGRSFPMEIQGYFWIDAVVLKNVN